MTDRGRRWAVGTAVAGTVCIALGAFWLSFTSLADLAARSGIGAGQAWVWPLIVDGIIVVATVAVVALAGTREAWYPWTLLIGGAAVSVAANALHSVVAAHADVPGLLAASVAAIPPIVLLSITHLTVILTRHPDPHPLSVLDDSVLLTATSPVERSASTEAPGRDAATRRMRAVSLREQGRSNKAIARELGVHPSTIGRWFTTAHLPGNTTPEETP